MSHPSPLLTEIPDLGDGRFEILERIGAGGMGTVYKGVQKSVGRPVAIKVLSPDHASNPSGVVRFIREANVVSRLAHPNIVSVIDFGRDANGNLLLVMELLDGEPLRQTLRRQGKLSVGRAVSIATQVLSALRVAHGAGIIHRDLKPENIFLCRVDGGDLVKVLDFGVAKLLASDVGDQTTAGSLVGTLRYMAPEQIAGDPPDARVDLYATGVVLYEMLTGTLPYDYKDRLQLLRAVINDPPIPIHVRAPDLPPTLCDVVMRAIAKEPRERFASAEELRAALAPFASARSPEPLVLAASQTPGTMASHLVEHREHGGTVAPSSSNEFTTAAGLSAASRSEHRPGPRSTVFVLGATAVGIVTLAGSVGILLARARHESHVTVAPPPPVRAVRTADASQLQPTPAASAVVLVHTDPPGAALRDSTTGELLCTATPCAVAVASGHARRVTLSLGGTSVQALLEPGLSPFLVDLRGAGRTTPSPPPPEPRAPAGTARPSRRQRGRDESQSLPMFAPHGDTEVQMFAPRSR